MKNFKTFLEAVSAQKASKDFEDYIWQLAVLSGGKETNVKKLEKVLDKNEDKFQNMSAKHRGQTLDAVSHLNKFFKKKWTKGYNANFATIPSPVYGNKSAKADIVLESGSKKYGLSVKMAGDYVVVSAQNKDEFEGIFYSALDYFEENNSVDLSDYEQDIENIKTEVKLIKKNIIGETLTRNLSPTHFDKLKKEKGFSKNKEFLTNLSDQIEKQNKKINDDYSDLMANVVKTSQKKIRDLIDSNEVLRSYIVWEALTASLKYKRQLPFAEYVISPTGCYDIRTPNSKFVQSVAKASKIGIRGMVHGKLRSGSAKALQPYLNKSNLNWNDVYSDLNKMDISLKWDMPSKAFEKLEVEEGIFSDIWNKIKGIWNNIKEKISNAITSAMTVANNVLDKLTELKNASIFDLIQSNNIEIDAKIKIP